MDMVVKLFDKLIKRKSTCYHEELTAENAQKIADAALKAKTEEWGKMAVDYALKMVCSMSESAHYSAYYNLYGSGPLGEATESITLTEKQARAIDNFVTEKLVALGYKVELGHYGPNRTITISWGRKEEKK